MWINCALLNKRTESLAQYLTKGKLIAVEGTLEPLRRYTTRDGDTRTSLEVTVNNGTFCGARSRRRKHKNSQHSTAKKSPTKIYLSRQKVQAAIVAVMLRDGYLSALGDE